MNEYLKEFSIIVGLSVCLATAFISVVFVTGAFRMGLDAQVLLRHCNNTHQQQCELIAVPKETD